MYANAATNVYMIFCPSGLDAGVITKVMVDY